MADIELTEDRGVATLLINRADKGNAIHLRALAEMQAHLETLASSDIRALVITGAGERVFSAGMDLSDVADPGAWAENPLTRFCDTLQAFPKPTIARINGAVIGGAVEIAMSCDFRIGPDDTKMRVPAIDLGIHYEIEGIRRMVDQLGVQAARRVYMVGDKFDAKAMLDLGFLDRMAPRAELDQAVEDRLSQIRASAPLAANGIKQAIVEIMARQGPEAAKERIRAAWASDDLKEGLAAMKEKRPPVFRGR